MPDKQPNIVFILSDNVGWGDFSCYGGSTATPRIDKLASEGIRFTDYARVRVARDELRRIRELTRAERALERELTAQIKALRPDLLAEQGVGPTTAATLIGRTAGAERFPTDGHFAGRPASHPSRHPQDARPECGSTAAVTASSTARCTASL